jgi:cell division protein FtsN
VNRFRWLSLTIAACLAAGALAACSSARDDFNKASAANTIAAYQEFLKQHPNTDLAVQAQSRLNALEDDQAWSDAQKANTLEAYQKYLQAQPSGMHSADARDRITGLERADAWKSAQAANTPEAIQAFLQKYPTGPEADQAKAQLQQLQSEQYRVQVASFKARKDADRARTKLEAKYGKVLHSVIVVPPTASEKLTTVRSAPMTLKDAESACGTLKKEHQHCEVVKG